MNRLYRQTVFSAIACLWLLPQSGAQDNDAIPMDGLREVDFFFDAHAPELRHGSAALAARLDIQVTNVMVTSCKWRVGDRWLIEGDYELKDGRIEITSVQDYSGTCLHRSSSTRRLPAGLGTFRLLCELLKIDGEVRSNDLHQDVRDLETGERVRYVIDVMADRRLPDSIAEPGREDEAVLRELTREFIGLFCAERPTPLSRLPELLGVGYTHVESTGKVVKGRKAMGDVVESHRRRFKRFEETCEIRSCSISGHTAVVVAELDMGVARPPRGPLRRTATETLVFCRRGGQWRLIHTTLVWLGKPAAAARRPTAAAP